MLTCLFTMAMAKEKPTEWRWARFRIDRTRGRMGDEKIIHFEYFNFVRFLFSMAGLFIYLWILVNLMIVDDVTYKIK